MRTNNPNPPLITSKKCVKHQTYYPANEWCEDCLKEEIIIELCDNIIDKIDELIFELKYYNQLDVFNEKDLLDTLNKIKAIKVHFE